MKYTQYPNSSKLKRNSDRREHDEKLSDELHNQSTIYEDEELSRAEYDSDSDSSVEDSTDNESSGKEMDEKSNEKNEDHVEDHKKRKKSKIQLLDIAEFKKENLADLNYQIGNTESKVEKGVNIEPFNIDDEIEHGVFDKDGNYIKTENATENDQQDNEEWMNDVINTEEVNRLEKEQSVKTQNSRHYMVHEALNLLNFFLVNENETVLESLGRLNKLRKIAISKKNNSLKYVVHGIVLLSDLIDILEKKGFSEIYEYNRLKVQDALEEEFFDDSSRIVDHKTKLWGFKWLNKLDEYHGLYTNYEMSYWQKSYFKNSVIVKFHSEPDLDENWIHVSCLSFM
ncbi:XXYS1_4_G0002050.mRNA.1.CDS.1 [Saccharomyces cerevisiae]|nr:XXYS1_4_G0002050.mRNA.1.CDS.1 [Saccharomyces cerevisiae]